jgi:hypothetical protein
VATNATRPPDNGALPPAREGGCKVEPQRLTQRMIVWVPRWHFLQDPLRQGSGDTQLKMVL